MTDNLLKGAIADAKMVRETALANAKAALEEAFKPQIASMLSAKLRESAMNEDNDDTSGIGGSSVTVDDPAETKPSKAASDSSHIENPGQEVEDVFDGPTGMPKKTVSEAGIPGHEDDDMDKSAPVDDSPAPAAAPAPTGMGMGGAPAPAPAAPAPAPEMGGAPDAEAGFNGGEQGGDELDLEAIIRELEAEANGGSAAGGDVPEPALEGFDDPMCGKKVDGPITVKETLAGKSGDGEFHDGKSPAAVDGVNGGKKVSPGQEVTGSKADTMTEGEALSEEIDLDEILREMEAGSDVAPVAETAKIAAENVELKKSLREHREVVTFLRSKLNEVNMLNAKLLYTNKLFKAGSLTVEQKMKIVETFDRATTLREVKLIYSTLAESIVATPVKASASKTANAKAITEGLASKPVASTKPKNAQVLAEGDNAQRARLQKLAGIKIL